MSDPKIELNEWFKNIDKVKEGWAELSATDSVDSSYELGCAFFDILSRIPYGYNIRLEPSIQALFLTQLGKTPLEWLEHNLADIKGYHCRMHPNGKDIIITSHTEDCPECQGLGSYDEAIIEEVNLSQLDFSEEPIVKIKKAINCSHPR